MVGADKGMAHALLPDRGRREWRVRPAPQRPEFTGTDAQQRIARLTLNALIEAEELGITQANVDEKLQSQTSQVKRLAGTTGDFGKFMALANKWAFNAIRAVGNHGEIFERNFGPLTMPRGKNALWSKGGGGSCTRRPYGS